MYCNKPTVFRQTDLPPAFGPEMMRIRCSLFNSISSGTTFLPCLANESCNRGWIAVVQSKTCLSSNTGLIAFIWMAQCALARIKSISARNSYDCRIAGTCGRTVAENSVKIRMISLRSSASSSRMRLLASTTSAGSMKTVLPVADSSCTIPLIFRFKPGATGITRRPSRMVGVTSLSTNPSACAFRRMACKLREMLPVVEANSRRIRRSSEEALSLILPYLSRILLIRLISWGNTIISPASSRRCG